MSNIASIWIDPLTNNNFDTWKIHVEALLIKNNSWDYVSGKKVKPTPGSDGDRSKIEEWERADKQARSNFILTISSSELIQIKDCETSSAVWRKLHSIYQSKGPAKKSTLLKQIILNKMKENDNAKDHVDKFFEAVDKLKDMDMDINKDLLSILLLYSLPASYDNFRTAMEVRDELPDPEILKIKLIEKYESRNREISTDNAFYMKSGGSSINKKKNSGKAKYHGKNNDKNSVIKCFRCYKETANSKNSYKENANQVEQSYYSEVINSAFAISENDKP